MAQQQSKPQAALQKVDPVWAKIRDEAEDVVRREPEIGTFIYSSILHHDSWRRRWCIGSASGSTMPTSRRN